MQGCMCRAILECEFEDRSDYVKAIMADDYVCGSCIKSELESHENAQIINNSDPKLSGK